MWKIMWKKSKCRKIMKCVVYLSGFFGRVLYFLWGAIAKHQLIANAVRSSREKLVVDPVPIYTFRGSGIFVIRSSKYQNSLSVLRDYFLVLFFSFIFFFIFTIFSSNNRMQLHFLFTVKIRRAKRLRD